MRIGFDVDGVLADFTRGFVPLLVKVTGKDLFQPGDIDNPPCWNWDLHRGYTKEESRAAWAVIKESHHWWTNLRPTPNVRTLRMMILDLMRNHEVYYITNRMGKDVKWQTELWLRQHLEIDLPTVLISGSKGLCAKALRLDCYLDDNLDNANDVVQATLPKTEKEFIPIAEGLAKISPGVDMFELAKRAAETPQTRTYLLDKSYNQSNGLGNGPLDSRVTRVGTLGQFLDAELVNL